MGGFMHDCHHPDLARSVINGKVKPVNCQEVRNEGGLCGPGGALWEPSTFWQRNWPIIVLGVVVVAAGVGLSLG